MQTSLQLDIWLQSYEGFDNARNNMKQRNFNTGFANISETTSPTSGSFIWSCHTYVTENMEPLVIGWEDTEILEQSWQNIRRIVLDKETRRGHRHEQRRGVHILDSTLIL